MRIRQAASAVLLSVAALTVAPAVGARAATPSLPWLRVAAQVGGRPQVVDPAGRTVILRGTNLVGLEDDFYRQPDGSEGGAAPFWPIDPSAYRGTCPANSFRAGEPPVCELQAGLPEYQQSAAASSENDLAQIRALGFDVIRLPVSWSLLEPAPGRYDPAYIDRIAQVVDWARQQGIYVLIDMHQDAYSRFTPETAPLSASPLASASIESANHADGAPAWAVLASGVPAEAVNGQPELNAYVEAAFTSFWLNRVPTDANGSPLPQGEAPGPGLQDHYIGAIARLATRFKNDPAVVGYEIMNEPLPGVIPFPGPFDQGYLFPFYRRVIDAITGTSDGIVCPTGITYSAACGYRSLGIDDRRHLFFFEPMVVRNETDFAVGASAPFSSYPNLVYAPHVYTHVFTVDTNDPTGTASKVYPVSYDQAMQTADAEARLLRAALLVGEYGNGSADDPRILAPETAALDRAGAGATQWLWKSNCTGSCWGVYEGAAPAQNGPVIASREQFLSRAYPRAVAGQLKSFSYDPASRTFAMNAADGTRVRRGDRGRETMVYVPPGVPGAVGVTGAAALDTVVSEPDGSRLLYVAPTGGGAYAVTVG